MIVTPANVQDRDAAPDLLASLGSAFPGCTTSLPMAAKLQEALNNLGDWTWEIVKRSDAAKGFYFATASLGCRADIRLVEP
jgi:hypothetical protein